jgi:hypothetical protein
MTDLPQPLEAGPAPESAPVPPITPVTHVTPFAAPRRGCAAH